MFTVLANTERWLSDTLAASQTDGPSSSNPFTRKEVSYVCENSPEAAMIVAGTFRRLKEAREQGETHGQMEEERLMEKGVLSS
jgi:malonyl CoA-acyl carrier protein transacylase